MKIINEEQEHSQDQQVQVPHRVRAYEYILRRFNEPQRFSVYHSITVMDQYRNRSFEELRCEDYNILKKH